jgi:pyrroline-5-carboxylate reductase
MSSHAEATTESIQIIGGGRMGEALALGLVNAGFCDAANLRIVDVVAERRDELVTLVPGATIADAPIAAVPAVLAVKPGYVEQVAAELGGLGVQRMLSIAAGVTIASIEGAAGGGVAVVRAMPNTPALVGEGASAVAGGTAATDDDLRWATEVLSSVGAVVEVPEPALDAVTGLSGSGPAYVFLFAEALIEGGVLEGLSREIATTLVAQTLLGSATLLRDGTEDAASLRAAVTSPGGTTAEGLRALEDHGLRSAILNAVAAAADRSRQLGRGDG